MIENLIIIPAKKYSNRLKNKNMINANGKPLIEYTINFVLQEDMDYELIVSTDSEEIINYCNDLNIKTVFRDQSLIGETPIFDVYCDVIVKQCANIPPKLTIGLQPDHPDRTTSLIDAIYFFNSNNLDVMYSQNSNKEKNGSYFFFSDYYYLNKKSRKTKYFVDDATNIHDKNDLIKACKNLKKEN